MSRVMIIMKFSGGGCGYGRGGGLLVVPSPSHLTKLSLLALSELPPTPHLPLDVGAFFFLGLAYIMSRKRCVGCVSNLNHHHRRRPSTKYWERYANKQVSPWWRWRVDGLRRRSMRRRCCPNVRHLYIDVAHKDIVRGRSALTCGCDVSC